jgi:putative DNA primase/helicase
VGRTMLSLRNIAVALAGEVVAGQVLAPSPGHSRKDRSLSVRPAGAARDGFICHSFAGEDWKVCHNYVRERLGLPTDHWKRDRARPVLRVADASPRTDGHDNGTDVALALWHASVDPRGTLVEKYLLSRNLSQIDDIAGNVLRWHPGIGAMIALFRNIGSDDPQAISRAYLDPQGRKIDRKFLGPVGGAAIKLDADENVTAGLHLAEGVETALAARELGLRPAWAVGSAGAIAAFPILPGIESLTLLAENDEASARAVEACAKRWDGAGREVFINRPIDGKDLNDAIRGAA